jgi:predicted TIM-barrel fold metal-dependent hydrolase
MPDWTPDAALETMATLDVATAILSVSVPGTAFLPRPADAAALARDVNDYSADLVGHSPDRFGFFATVPLPHVDHAVAETVRALDELFAAPDARSAVAFVHPATLPGPEVPGIPPFATDFLLDTTRAAYLLVSNGVRHRYPNIRFILGHAGGFVPYASHRMAVTIFGETGRSPFEVLDDFAGFYFDTALSSSPAALPTLLAFAKPGHVTFGSDWPFAPLPASQYFAEGLDDYADLDGSARAAIDHGNALALFPRLG